MVYRYIDIDLTRGADDVCSSYAIGRDGENRAEALRITLPERYLNCNILLEFALADGSKFVSKLLPYAEVIEYPLESYLMLEGLMVIGVVAVDATTGAVYKPFEKTFVVSGALNVLPSDGAPYGVVADHEKRLAEVEKTVDGLEAVEGEVAKNSEARHEHSNMTVLDKLGASGDSLTYDGQPIKGGGGQADWQQPDPAAVDYIKNRTHYETVPFAVAWDGDTEGRESVYLFDVQGDESTYSMYLVKVADDIAAPLAFETLTADDLKFDDGGNTVPGGDIVGSFTVTKFNGGYMVAPYLVYCAADSVQVELTEFETTVTVGKGLWYVFGGGTYLKSVSFPASVHQLEKRYIPELEKTMIILSENKQAAVIGVTDRDGKVISAVGVPTTASVPKKGVDYWTSEDKREIVNDVIEALPKWMGGDY